MKPPPHPELLTKALAAKYLNIKQRTLDDWRAEGIVPYIMIGPRFIRFRKSDLDELLERHYVPAQHANARLESLSLVATKTSA